MMWHPQGGGGLLLWERGQRIGNHNGGEIEVDKIERDTDKGQY